jgi:prolyl oligopeptidase
LQNCHAIGDRLALLYLRDATSALIITDADGHNANDVALPGLGTVGSLDGDEANSSAYFTYTSFFDPPGIWRCDLATGTVKPIALPTSTPDTAGLITEQVWYSSADGTRVPMFIICRAMVRAPRC